TATEVPNRAPASPSSATSGSPCVHDPASSRAKTYAAPVLPSRAGDPTTTRSPEIATEYPKFACGLWSWGTSFFVRRHCPSSNVNTYAAPVFVPAVVLWCAPTTSVLPEMATDTPKFSPVSSPLSSCCTQPRVPASPPPGAVAAAIGGGGTDGASEAHDTATAR